MKFIASAGKIDFKNSLLCPKWNWVKAKFSKFTMFSNGTTLYAGLKI